jgi:hypothetical protein
MDWELSLTHTEESAPIEVLDESDQEGGFSDEDRRAKRLARNRESARDSRRRRKGKEQLLESRVAELSAEVTRLRMAAEITAPDYTDRTMQATAASLCYRLATALANPATPDSDIETLVGEFNSIVDSNGKNRTDSLKETFRQTMEMMIPMHVKFCLWVCRTDPSCSQSVPPKWEDLVLNTSLISAQIARFREYQRKFGREKLGLVEAFQDLKKMMEKIMQHAKSLNSILVDLKPLLEPRQIGQFALWLQHFCVQSDTGN